MYEKTIPKPCKSYGTHWIYHKLCSMEIVLCNCGVFMKQLESLAQTDSQSLKQAELESSIKKWMNAKYHIHLAIYLDILTSLKVLSLGFQKEIHDPVSAVQCTEFKWTMAKLKLLLIILWKTTQHVWLISLSSWKKNQSMKIVNTCIKMSSWKTLHLQGNQSHTCMRRSLLIWPCQSKSDSRIL